MAEHTPVYGAIEAGGTKFVCAVGTGPDDIRAITRFPTTRPEETLGQAIAFFREQPEPVAAIGIGSFGPVDPRPGSPTFGYVTTTPKPHWSNTDVAGAIGRELGVPVAFDTDVNAAALGEHRWGAAQGLDTVVYLTIGTGIGGGAMINGQLVHGLLHPEMGHMPLPRDPERDPFVGACPYHGDCWEGLAAGPSMLARWGQPAETLPADHPAWDLEAHYITLALANLIYVISPQRIILGGGVMSQEQLFPMIHDKVLRLLAGYVQVAQILDDITGYIVPPALGSRAGVLGSLALAMQLDSIRA